VIIKESPVLQSLTRTGKVKYWKLVAFTEMVASHTDSTMDGFHFYKKVWWQEGSKVQESTPVQVKGKNVGRANETSDEEQLISEFHSLVQKQRDKGYSEDGSADHIPTKPMLAHKYKERKHKVVFPCYVQPKLNGYRMLKEGDGKTAWTRGGKAHVEECVEHLMWFTFDVMTDGELILPDMPLLQVTARAAKKFREGVSETLMYMVYDKVDANNPFPVRYMSLKLLEPTFPKRVKLVTTIEVKNEQELFEAHVRFTSQGYEGTIVRSGEDGYNIGHRSNSLLKLKDFQDAEFKIKGVRDGKGSFKGKAVFICETKDGYVFDVAPEGTMEHRAELYKTREDHIGKWLTVRYQDLTEDGAPNFPIGVVIREEGEF
jgi:DNA ligase-1